MKPAVGCPLDRPVRLKAVGDGPVCRTEPDGGNGLVPKRTDAGGTGEAGAYPTPAAWRCGTPQGQRETQALRETYALPGLLVRERQMVQGRRRAAPEEPCARCRAKQPMQRRASEPARPYAGRRRTDSTVQW